MSSTERRAKAAKVLEKLASAISAHEGGDFLCRISASSVRAHIIVVFVVGAGA